MKVSVRVRGLWLAVPCGAGQHTIEWLGKEALKRYYRADSSTSSTLEDAENNAKKFCIANIRKTRGGALLEPGDAIKEVLDDEDFVSVGA